MSDTPETHIHIESRIDGAVHVSGSVYVNGTPVLLAEDGLGIEYGFNDMTTVTLKILPKTLTFGGSLSADSGVDADFTPPTRAELVDLVLHGTAGGKA